MIKDLGILSNDLIVKLFSRMTQELIDTYLLVLLTID
jgi:hypothetical protein